MSASRIAKRYAVAAVSLCNETTALEKLAEEAEAFSQACAHESYAEFFLHPKITKAQKSEALEQIISKLSFSVTMIGCLRLLLKNDRLAIAPEFSTWVGRLVDERLNRARVTAVVSSKMSSSLKTKTITALERFLNKSVMLNVEVDPEILGGIVLKIGSQIYDSSLRSRLTSITGIV